MGRGGQSSYGYMYGDGELPKAAPAKAEPAPREVKASSKEHFPMPKPNVTQPVETVKQGPQGPAGIHSRTPNNYFRADGQKTGNYFLDAKMGSSENREVSRSAYQSAGTEATQVKEKEDQIAKIVTVGASLVAAGTAAWGLWKVLSGESSSTDDQRKTMKAPGRNRRIVREDFERNPRGYFRDLHKK